MNVNELSSWVLPTATFITVVGGAGIMIVQGIKRGIHVFGRIAQFLDDWQGTPARPGFPETLGIPARLQKIENATVKMDARIQHVEHRLTPNGGSSIADAVTRIEHTLKTTHEGSVHNNDSSTVA